jgi:glycosyltransferase involved in cell wall biosynthesis
MFVTTIIPTIGRPTLARAVRSVLDQAFDAADVEVIVVNDSGKPLPEEDWQRADRVRVVDTVRRERSVARNTGAAIARGKYFHFLDDDDLLLPGALAAFWELEKQLGDADWMYGAWQTVDNEGRVVDEFRPDLRGNIFALVISGEALPLQGSLIRSSHFFNVGGYDPDPNLIGVEDRELGRRLALAGTICNTDRLVAQIRIGEISSTTDWSRIAARDRWGREKALCAHGSFERLTASAETGYWRGRVSRAYFASAVWNAQRWQIITAVSRALSGMWFAGWRTLTAAYWDGLRTKIR